MSIDLSKAKDTDSSGKPKYEPHSIVEKVTPPEVEVNLWCDMDRFSNGSIHGGFHLASYSEEKAKGIITAGGDEITISVNGRTWGINLSTLVQLAVNADLQREKKLAGAQ
jgi:hypothetical protein